MGRLHLALACAVLGPLGACAKDPAPRHPPGGTLHARAAPQDTAVPFRSAGTAVHRPRPRASPASLRGASATADAGYDRVVFEFSGDSVPGYHVEYTDRPVRACGSGAVVRVSGSGRLIVRFEPARAHDDRGNATVVERARAPALPIVKEMKLICDFEGQVEWVLGLSEAHSYRVMELVDPARLIVDVRHRE